MFNTCKLVIGQVAAAAVRLGALLMTTHPPSKPKRTDVGALPHMSGAHGFASMVAGCKATLTPLPYVTYQLGKNGTEARFACTCHKADES